MLKSDYSLFMIITGGANIVLCDNAVNFIVVTQLASGSPIESQDGSSVVFFIFPPYADSASTSN